MSTVRQLSPAELCLQIQEKIQTQVTAIQKQIEEVQAQVPDKKSLSIHDPKTLDQAESLIQPLHRILENINKINTQLSTEIGQELFPEVKASKEYIKLMTTKEGLESTLINLKKQALESYHEVADRPIQKNFDQIKRLILEELQKPLPQIILPSPDEGGLTNLNNNLPILEEFKKKRGQVKSIKKLLEQIYQILPIDDIKALLELCDNLMTACDSFEKIVEIRQKYPATSNPLPTLEQLSAELSVVYKSLEEKINSAMQKLGPVDVSSRLAIAEDIHRQPNQLIREKKLTPDGKQDPTRMTFARDIESPTPEINEIQNKIDSAQENITKLKQLKTQRKLAKNYLNSAAKDLKSVIAGGKGFPAFHEEYFLSRFEPDNKNQPSSTTKKDYITMLRQRFLELGWDAKDIKYYFPEGATQTNYGLKELDTLYTQLRENRSDERHSQRIQQLFTSEDNKASPKQLQFLQKLLADDGFLGKKHAEGLQKAIEELNVKIANQEKSLDALNKANSEQQLITWYKNFKPLVLHLERLRKFGNPLAREIYDANVHAIQIEADNLKKQMADEKEKIKAAKGFKNYDQLKHSKHWESKISTLKNQIDALETYAKSSMLTGVDVSKIDSNLIVGLKSDLEELTTLREEQLNKIANWEREIVLNTPRDSEKKQEIPDFNNYCANLEKEQNDVIKSFLQEMEENIDVALASDKVLPFFEQYAGLLDDPGDEKTPTFEAALQKRLPQKLRDDFKTHHAKCVERSKELLSFSHHHRNSTTVVNYLKNLQHELNQIRTQKEESPRKTDRKEIQPSLEEKTTKPHWLLIGALSLVAVPFAVASFAGLLTLSIAASAPLAVGAGIWYVGEKIYGAWKKKQGVLQDRNYRGEWQQKEKLKENVKSIEESYIRVHQQLNPANVLTGIKEIEKAEVSSVKKLASLIVLLKNFREEKESILKNYPFYDSNHPLHALAKSSLESLKEQAQTIQSLISRAFCDRRDLLKIDLEFAKRSVNPNQTIRQEIHDLRELDMKELSESNTFLAEELEKLKKDYCTSVLTLGRNTPVLFIPPPPSGSKPTPKKQPQKPSTPHPGGC